MTLDGFIDFKFTEVEREILQADLQLNNTAGIPLVYQDSSQVNFFIEDIKLKLESLSYLVVDGLKTHLSDLNAQTQISGMTGKLQDILERGKGYLANYSDKIGKQTGKEQQRLSSIEKGIQTVTKFYQDIQEKCKLFTEMNPSMEVQSLLEHANLSIYIENREILNYTERWPLIVHFLCTVFCLGSSAIYHQFNLKNKEVQMMLARLDYGGICLQICGSTYPVIVYTFSCN